MNLIDPCERCGAMCEHSVVLSWDRAKPRQLCLTCLDAFAQEHIRNNPPSKTVGCVGCGAETEREEMRMLAGENGAVLLCPMCIR